MIDEIFLWKFLKFCIVGFTGMTIDFGTTWLLKEKVRINKYVANSAGFILAASSNYAFNRFWTFHSETPHVVVQYISFLSVSVIGLGINNLVVYILNDRFRLNFYFSKLFAIAVVTLWNFLMNYFITFKLF
jgi:putative flippase GtrA